MKRVLFFAYTPFQAIAALAIKEQYYKEDSASIILAESVQSRDSMKRNIEDFQLFKRVYFANIRLFFPKEKNKIKHEMNRLKSAIVPCFMANEIGLEEDFDIFITTEVNYYTESIFSLLRKMNPDVQVELMDEGYSSYTFYFKEAYRPTTLKNLIKSSLFKIPGYLYGRKFIAQEAKFIYYFAPELLCWKELPYIVKRIDVKGKKEFYRDMNRMFGFDRLNELGLNEEYDRPYLYFEESFFWSTRNNNDISIIDHIADIVGKSNIAIKLHPRNEINRFAQQGYKTNTTYGIPWELVAVNLPISDKRVFLSFSSGAVLNYKFLSNKSFKTILLYKCIGDQFYHVNEDLKLWFDKFASQYGNSVYIPKTMEELDDLLINIAKL